MSLRNVEVRLLADEDTTGDVRFVEAFGHVIGTDFTKVELDDHAFEKLSRNPHFEVKEARSRASRTETAPAAE